LIIKRCSQLLAGPAIAGQAREGIGIALNN
jgi:hypothetical protein